MRILLVDSKGDMLEQVLCEASEGYVVDTAYNEDDGQYLFEVNEYDAVVVGPGMDETHDISLCRNIKSSTPALPIAVINKESNSAAILDSGADVCIRYPIEAEELKAQVRALIRRNTLSGINIISIGDLTLDYSEKIVFIKKSRIYLRRKEYDILEYLLINKNRIVTKEKLLEHVWEEGIYSFSNLVEVHIRNLRQALRSFGIKNLIKTVRGFGYIIEA